MSALGCGNAEVLAARLLSATFAVVACLVLHGWLVRARASEARVVAVAWGVWWLTRPLLFLAVFGLLGAPVSSDAAVFYFPQAESALRGLIAYRDFDSSYGPLFPYVAGLFVAGWHSPHALVIAAIGFDALAMWLWPLATRDAVTARASAEALLLYACSPLVIWNVTLGGHNQVWLSVGLALSLLLLMRGKAMGSGAMLALAASAVKLLALVPAVYLMLVAGLGARAASLRLRFAAGLAGMLCVVFLPFALLGAPVLQPLVDEGAKITSGNLPFLLGVDAPSVAIALPLLGVCVVMASVVLWRRGVAHHAGVSALMLVVMLLSPKAYTTYLVIVWFPIALVVVERGLSIRALAMFSVLSVLATIEPSLWFRWLEQRSLPEAIAAVGEGRVSLTRLAVFVAVEVALLAGYVWLSLRAIGRWYASR